ncbi:hypothetical protein CQ12_20085 [Bradyrhizobium jicamae]|uniref:Uncharacterized protein n=1 Tax=Bradyrhizobium jicamae TaxID=280332 RepID=A0A0R3LHT2_9BRAD|nr:hypothetical protein [Bradyrhizobium jicamae]KRR05357.1 hypothetical protein CQ12_20085 [Bradyrhizobium jicamae]
MTAEPVAPCGRDPFVPLQFAFRPGNGMTIGEFSENLPVMMATMMAPLVMTAASVPPVMMTAASVSVTVVAVPVPALDLDHGAVFGGQGRDAHSGGRGQGHCQRSDQSRANQNDTSHAGVLPIA